MDAATAAGELVVMLYDTPSSAVQLRVMVISSVPSSLASIREGLGITGQFWYQLITIS